NIATSITIPNLDWYLGGLKSTRLRSRCCRSLSKRLFLLGQKRGHQVSLVGRSQEDASKVCRPTQTPGRQAAPFDEAVQGFLPAGRRALKALHLRLSQPCAFEPSARA